MSDERDTPRDDKQDALQEIHDTLRSRRDAQRAEQDAKRDLLDFDEQSAYEMNEIRNEMRNEMGNVVNPFLIFARLHMIQETKQETISN
ncbi:hypothetical protein LCGC14_0377680 [marine sediment metagenome]|uniref:Uncharacterized protein n=1 Tax=marine sediment metagenome TaxID=412755 RepID=A0A0F9VQB5_9ZZZZ